MNKKIETFIKNKIKEFGINEKTNSIFLYRKNKIENDLLNYKFEDKKIKFDDNSLDLIVINPEIIIDKNIIVEINRLLRDGGYFICIGTDMMYPFNIFRKYKQNSYKIRYLCQKENLITIDSKRMMIGFYKMYFLLSFKKEKLAKIENKQTFKIKDYDLQGSFAGASMIQT